MEKHPLHPKRSGCAPALESGFLKQEFTFSIIVQFFSAVEEPIVFKIKQTNIIKVSQSVLHLLVSI